MTGCDGLPEPAAPAARQYLAPGPPWLREQAVAAAPVSALVKRVLIIWSELPKSRLRADLGATVTETLKNSRWLL